MTEVSEASAEPVRAPRAGPWVLALVAGLLLVLVAQFGLDAWAEQSDAAHWAQHALLFWSGVLTGVALLRLYQLGGRRS